MWIGEPSYLMGVGLDSQTERLKFQNHQWVSSGHTFYHESLAQSFAYSEQMAQRRKMIPKNNSRLALKIRVQTRVTNAPVDIARRDE